MEQGRREKEREPGLARGVALRRTRTRRCPRKRSAFFRDLDEIWVSGAAQARDGEWARVRDEEWAPVGA